MKASSSTEAPTKKPSKRKVPRTQDGEINYAKIAIYYKDGAMTEEDIYEMLLNDPTTKGYCDWEFFQSGFMTIIRQYARTLTGKRNFVDTYVKPKVDTKINPKDEESKEEFEEDTKKAKEILEDMRKSGKSKEDGYQRRQTNKRDRGAKRSGIDILNCSPEMAEKLANQGFNIKIETKTLKLNISDELRKKARNMSPKVTGRLRYVPGYFVFEKLEREQIAYEDEYGNTHILTADSDKLLPKTKSSPSVMSFLFDSYLTGMPLNRLETKLANEGIKFPRQTMTDWMNKTSRTYFEPVVMRMKEDANEQAHGHADETELAAVLVIKELGKQKTYMFCLTSGEIMPRQITLYEFIEDRKQSTMKEQLKDVQGSVGSDLGAWYTIQVIDEDRHCLCWAHMRRPVERIYKHREELKEYTRIENIEDPEERRKEMEVFRSLPGNKTFLLLHKEMTLIARIYAIESFAKKNHTTVNETLAIRENVSLPLFRELVETVELLDSDCIKNSELGRACHYLLDHVDQFELVFHDGTMDLDNSAVERALKAVVLNRKNFIHLQTREGARCLATSLSLYKTAINHDLRPRAFMEHVLEVLQPYMRYDEKLKEPVLEAPEEVIESLLPYNLQPKELYTTEEAWLNAIELQKKCSNSSINAKEELRQSDNDSKPV